MKWLLLNVCLLLLIQLSLSAPPGKKDDHVIVEMSEEEKRLRTEQDTEYYRYIQQIMTELVKDDTMSKALENLTDDDIHAGGAIERLKLAPQDLRQRLDEVKRVEVERQRELIKKQAALHLKTKDQGNAWHPIHHDNKEEFTEEDLVKLAKKHAHMLELVETRRKKEFKIYEMEKAQKRKAKLAKMNKEEKEAFLKKEKEEEEADKEHEKIHEPGSKAQLQETWEKDDGLEGDYDVKTLFNLHDKNGDGYLDVFEVETTLLSEINKAYNESNPHTDENERKEELDKMAEHFFEQVDKDGDKLISLEEVIQHEDDKEMQEDNEWKPGTEEEQFTEEEFAEYEKEHPYEEEEEEPPAEVQPNDEQHTEEETHET